MLQMALPGQALQLRACFPGGGCHGASQRPPTAWCGVNFGLTGCYPHCCGPKPSAPEQQRLPCTSQRQVKAQAGRVERRAGAARRGRHSLRSYLRGLSPDLEHERWKFVFSRAQGRRAPASWCGWSETEEGRDLLVAGTAMAAGVSYSLSRSKGSGSRGTARTQCRNPAQKPPLQAGRDPPCPALPHAVLSTPQLPFPGGEKRGTGKQPQLRDAAHRAPAALQARTRKAFLGGEEDRGTSEPAWVLGSEPSAPKRGAAPHHPAPAHLHSSQGRRRPAVTLSTPEAPLAGTKLP